MYTRVPVSARGGVSQFSDTTIAASTSLPESLPLTPSLGLTRSLLQSILDDPEGEKADITKQGAKSTITRAQAAIDELTTGVDARNKVLDEAIEHRQLVQCGVRTP